MSALGDLLRRYDGAPVAVIGDVMLDHFVVGRVDRISPEAPVPVVRFERDEYRLGGAANVAHNIARLGGVPTLVGLVGDDDAGRQLRLELGDAGVSDEMLVTDASRPTTRKLRVVTPRHQQVVRIDHEADTEATGGAHDALAGAIAGLTDRARAIVLSDYRKGVITPAVIAAAVAAATARRVPLLVDPKVPLAERYRGATLITPNHHEAELMTQQAIRTTDDARAAARALHARTGASVLITWGEHGMWVLDASGDSLVEDRLPAVAREVADVTGAGDTVIAALGLGLAAGASLVNAARLANIAAGLVVARFGPATVTGDELLAALTAADL